MAEIIDKRRSGDSLIRRQGVLASDQQFIVHVKQGWYISWSVYGTMRLISCLDARQDPGRIWLNQVEQCQRWPITQDYWLS